VLINEQKIRPKSVYGVDLGDNFQGDGSQVKRLDRKGALVPVSASGDGRSGIFTWREEP
jgi:hypothetical protein